MQENCESIASWLSWGVDLQQFCYVLERRGAIWATNLSQEEALCEKDDVGVFGLAPLETDLVADLSAIFAEHLMGDALRQGYASNTTRLSAACSLGTYSG